MPEPEEDVEGMVAGLLRYDLLAPTNKSGPFLVRWSPLLFQAAVLYTCGL